jgi:hypothetical protein
LAGAAGAALEAGEPNIMVVFLAGAGGGAAGAPNIIVEFPAAGVGARGGGGASTCVNRAVKT